MYYITCTWHGAVYNTHTHKHTHSQTHTHTHTHTGAGHGAPDSAGCGGAPRCGANVCC